MHLYIVIYRQTQTCNIHLAIGRSICPKGQIRNITSKPMLESARAIQKEEWLKSENTYFFHYFFLRLLKCIWMYRKFPYDSHVIWKHNQSFKCRAGLVLLLCLLRSSYPLPYPPSFSWLFLLNLPDLFNHCRRKNCILQGIVPNIGACVSEKSEI